MKELLEVMAKGLVEDKEAVRVTVDEPNEEGVIVYHLSVAEGDVGRVIGKQGKIAKIEGLDQWEKDDRVVANIQRLHEGDTVPPEWIGNEKQVLTRLYLVCNSKMELADTLKYYMNTVRVTDEQGNNMLLKGFDVNKALELK